jgi:DNA-binding beta-propeller fold protein YncE
VALSADGKLGVAAQLRPKNLIPLAHVEHGWVFGDSLTLFGDDVGGTVQVPIDELDRYYALPWGVAITPDKSKMFVTTAGSENVTVVDVRESCWSYVRQTPHAPVVRRPSVISRTIFPHRRIT